MIAAERGKVLQRLFDRVVFAAPAPRAEGVRAR